MALGRTGGHGRPVAEHVTVGYEKELGAVPILPRDMGDTDVLGNLAKLSNVLTENAQVNALFLVHKNCSCIYDVSSLNLTIEVYTEGGNRLKLYCRYIYIYIYIQSLV